MIVFKDPITHALNTLIISWNKTGLFKKKIKTPILTASMIDDISQQKIFLAHFKIQCIIKMYMYIPLHDHDLTNLAFLQGKF
jgi:hypothetical protein